MGQVCFTAISSNRACHHGLHCSQFSVPSRVHCVRIPVFFGWGQGARSLSSLVHCLGQLSPVVLWGCKHSARLTPYAWSIGVGRGMS